MTHQIYLGDEAKVVKAGPHHSFQLGTKVKVVQIDIYMYLVTDGVNKTWLCGNELELLNTSTHDQQP